MIRVINSGVGSSSSAITKGEILSVNNKPIENKIKVGFVRMIYSQKSESKTLLMNQLDVDATFDEVVTLPSHECKWFHLAEHNPKGPYSRLS